MKILFRSCVTLFLVFFFSLSLAAERKDEGTLRGWATDLCLLRLPTPKKAEKALKKIRSLHAGWANVYPDPQSSDFFIVQLEASLPEETDGRSRKRLDEKLKRIAEDFDGTFESCESLRPQVAKKPVIYLYPPEPKEIEVRLDYRGTLTSSYPDYDPKLKGWKVTAHPDGRLIDAADGREYNYLFWEGTPEPEARFDLSEGFIVKGEDTKHFLQKTLKEMGLVPHEFNEFIVYWLPRMEKNPYNLIHFADEEYSATAPLTITPKPDGLLRVFMVFKALREPVEIKKQKLKPFQRTGFSVVEWGGMEIP